MIGHVMGDITLLSYYALIPEVYLCCCALGLLVHGVYRAKFVTKAEILTAIFVLLFGIWLESHVSSERDFVMNGMFVSDVYGVVAKSLILGAGALVLLLSSAWLREGERPFEYIVLQLFAMLGMMFMVSANDFITMYLALEMSSLSLYVLASFSRDDAKSSEAGLKYFVLGALASGMMLFGMSLVYGFAGTTGFEGLAKLFIANGADVSKGVIVGMILVVVGLCFKVSAVPFHMWTPDVYEGAPTPVTAFFATAPKAAALFLFTRVMLQPFGALVAQWQQIIVFVALASMLVGALAGIMQSNIKRLLAYSSISHVGFILMGLVAGGVAGVQAIVVYIALYIFMSAGAFGCLMLMRREGQSHEKMVIEEIKDFSGLAQTHPAIAMLLSVFMFSMAGIPPLAGFFGKMMVVLAAVGAGYTWLAAIGVITSVISGFYYIKIVKVMYFDEPAQPLDIESAFLPRLAVGISALVTLAFFLMPMPLMNIAKSAAEALLK